MTFEPVSYRLDEASYVRLHKALSLRGGWWVVTGLAVIYILINGTDLIMGSLDPVSLLLIPSIFVTTFCTLHFLVVPRRARGIFREQANTGHERRLVLSEDGLEINQSNGNFQTDWTHLIMWRETAGFLVLYVNRAMMVPLPLEQIGEERAAFIRERLTASGLPWQGKRRK